MRIPRIFIDEPLSGRSRVALPEDARRHVRTVLRRECGQQLILFDGRGGEYLASIESSAPSGVVVSIDEARQAQRELLPAVSLWQSICRGGRMDYVIEKATELGVHEMVPITTRRSVVRLNEKRARQRQRHWQGIARSASEQSGRTSVPQVCVPVALQHSLDALRESTSPALLLSPDARLSLAGYLESCGARPGALTFIVGPEGGFEPDEEAALADAGCTCVSLGPLTLRSDTAAIAALAMLRALSPAAPARRDAQ